MNTDINDWFQLQSQYNAPDQDWYSSSSSSLRSLSASSPECSPLFNTMPTSTPFSQTPAYYNSLNMNTECDNDVIMKAMLAVISSSPASSASSQTHSLTSQKSRTFKDYTSALAPISINSGKQNTPKRSISRNIPLSMRDELADDIHHTSSSQLQHKISERIRRKKLNESFQELRSLLPPESKKDKASVLSNTFDYLTNLKTEVMGLKLKNVSPEEAASDEATNVEIISVPSLFEEQEIEVRVTIRGYCDIIELALNILEYLKLTDEASLLSMDADTKFTQAKPINHIIFRLKIQKSEWDQTAFQEALNRIVTNVAMAN